MKIFYSNNGNKVNFVDELNNFVGYDITQQCCEDAGYKLYYYNGKKLSLSEDENYDDYNFLSVGSDERILEDVDALIDDEHVSGKQSLKFLDISHIIFILQSKQHSYDNLVLVLYNVHNGYYKHLYKHGTSDITTDYL